MVGTPTPTDCFPLYVNANKLPRDASYLHELGLHTHLQHSSSYIIKGGRSLRGTVSVSGSKNATLPILAATLLTAEQCLLSNVPNLGDVRTQLQILQRLGATVKAQGKTPNALNIQASCIATTSIPADLAQTMRACTVCMGPLLARFGRVRLSTFGGCDIGSRTIEQHLQALKCLGATVCFGDDHHDEYVEVIAPSGGLLGGDITLDMPSVGATQNVLMAATLARGTTVLSNAAIEPEIDELAEVLRSMGAIVDGVGTRRLKVVGQPALHGCTHTISPDRMEFGTFLIAGSLCGDPLKIRGGVPQQQSFLIGMLQDMGVDISVTDEEVTVRRCGPFDASGLCVKTEFYPGFPTDMQPLLSVLLAVSKGNSNITETIFENRFLYAEQLNKMGADIKVHGKTASICGSGDGRLKGGVVLCTDLRAGAALVLAGLVADGITVVQDIHHADRGYECLEVKLQAVGASIQRALRAVNRVCE